MDPRAIQVPGFALRRELGRGGMGVVIEAFSEQLGRPVALKLIHPDAPLDPETLARFRQEVAAASRLSHPNVVGVLGTGEVSGRPWVALELVEGESLAARLRRGGPLPAGEVVRIGMALADALDAAHRSGVLHRDLKPGNVLLDPGGAPLLTDFGLARLLDGEGRLTATGVVLGTPAYMAPEQASGDPRSIGPQADVYGLGALLYELLCGAPPFPGSSALAVMQAVLRRPPVPPSKVRGGVDLALEALVLRCLEKAPDRRPAGAAAVRDALSAWRPLAARRGRPLLIVGAGLALLALLALFVVVVPQPPPSPDPATPLLPAVAPPAPPAAPREALDAAARARAAGDAAAARQALQRALAAEDPLLAAEARWRLHELASEEDPEAPPGEELRALRAGPAAPPWTDLATAALALEERRPEETLRLARRAAEAGEAWGALLVARASLQLGDGPGAAAALDQASRLAPGSVAAHFVGTRLARFQRDMALHQRHLDGCLASPLLARERRIALLLERGKLRRVGGDRPGALADAEAALSLAPDHTHALRLRAGARLLRNDADGAAADLARLVELEADTPADAELELLRAQLAKRRKDHLSAVAALERALVLDGRDSGFVVELADSLFLLGRWEAAARLIDRALERPEALPAPGRALAMLLRAHLQARSGDLAGAEADLAALEGWDVVERDSDLRARLLWLGGDRAGARAIVDRLLERDPAHAGGLVVRAVCRAERGDLEGAEADASAALKAEPQLREALVRRAEIRNARGQPAGALEDLRAAERLAPLAIEEQVNVGVYLSGLGQLDEARRVLEGALELRPDGPLALLDHGRVCLAQGDTATALSSAERMCGLRGAHRAAGLLLRSQVRATQGDLAAAIEDARSAAREDPDPRRRAGIEAWLEQLRRRADGR